MAGLWTGLAWIIEDCVRRSRTAGLGGEGLGAALRPRDAAIYLMVSSGVLKLA